MSKNKYLTVHWGDFRFFISAAYFIGFASSGSLGSSPLSLWLTKITGWGLFIAQTSECDEAYELNLPLIGAPHQ